MGTCSLLHERPAKVCYIVEGSDVSLSLFYNEANLIHEGFAAFRI